MFKQSELNLKNCKNHNKKVKNNIKKDVLLQNNCDFDKSGVMLFAWVKTLLSIHDAIPNITKLVDKMVKVKATCATSGSSIFGDYKSGTYNQVEELLDMQERKLSLINLYTIIERMLECLPKKYQEFTKLKFYKHKTMQYVAEELNIDERTAFRWSNIILSKLVEFCEQNNWTVLFFKSQTQRESWIRDHYNKYYKKMLASSKV